MTTIPNSQPRISTDPHDDPWVNTKELSAEIKVPVGTLINWRYRGDGPHSSKFGRNVVYRRSEICKWQATKGDGVAMRWLAEHGYSGWLAEHGYAPNGVH